MKRTAKKIFVAATIAAVSIQSVPVASACGGRGGRSSYAPVYGGYSRAAANYRTTLPSTPPIHNAQPTYNPYYGQSVQTQPASSPTTVAAVQPRPRAQVAMQTSTSFQAGNQQASSSAVTEQAAASQPASTPDAESSALAALASLAASKPADTTKAAAPQTAASQASVPQFTSASTTSSEADGAPIGNFRAQLPSNITIELSLNSGNSFSWIVRNNGKTTQFSGQYRISEGRLTLVRSNDLQQMAGKMTGGANGFTFQLDGANNAGLEFKKV